MDDRDDRPKLKESYLYARHQGECDEAATDFVKWVEGHEDSGPLLNLRDAYQAWRDECDSITLWERQLNDGGIK